MLQYQAIVDAVRAVARTTRTSWPGSSARRRATSRTRSRSPSARNRRRQGRHAGGQQRRPRRQDHQGLRRRPPRSCLITDPSYSIGAEVLVASARRRRRPPRRRPRRPASRPPTTTVRPLPDLTPDRDVDHHATTPPPSRRRRPRPCQARARDRHAAGPGERQAAAAALRRRLQRVDDQRRRHRADRRRRATTSPRRACRSARSAGSPSRPGSRSRIVEVEPNANLDQLYFVSVVLYTPSVRPAVDEQCAPSCSDRSSGSSPSAWCSSASSARCSPRTDRSTWSIDVVLALVVGAGAGGGPERGAFAGFVLGMMFDLGGGHAARLVGAGLRPRRVGGRLRGHDHARSAVVAGGDVRRARRGGRRGGDPGDQVAHRPGRVDHRRRLAVILPVAGGGRVRCSARC